MFISQTTNPVAPFSLLAILTPRADNSYVLVTKQLHLVSLHLVTLDLVTLDLVTLDLVTCDRMSVPCHISEFLHL